MSIAELVVAEDDSRFDFLRRVALYTGKEGKEGTVYFHGGTKKSGIVEVRKNALCIYLSLDGGNIFKVKYKSIKRVKIIE